MNEHLRIANYLMLKSIELQDISLYHGKMGIVLALSLYAHQEGKKNLNDFAWDLLQDVYKGVNETLPIGLEYGLSGIGYGITLLKKHGIVDCILNEVLYDIDQNNLQIPDWNLSNFHSKSIGIDEDFAFFLVNNDTFE